MLKVATLEQWQLLKTLSHGGCEIDWADLTEPLWLGLEPPSFGAELLLTPRRLIICLRVRIVAHTPVVIARWGLRADWIKAASWLPRCEQHRDRYCLNDWPDTHVRFAPGGVLNQYVGEGLRLQRGAHVSGVLLVAASSIQQDEQDGEITVSLHDAMNNTFSQTLPVTFRNCTQGLMAPRDTPDAS